MTSLENEIWTTFTKRMDAAKDQDRINQVFDTDAPCDFNELGELFFSFDDLAECDDRLNVLIPRLKQEDPKAFERLGKRMIDHLKESAGHF